MRNFTLTFLLSVSCLFAKAEEPTNALPENPFAAFFEKAYTQHPGLPRGVLEAVAYTNSHFHHITHNTNDPQSCMGLPEYFGVMGLVADGKNYFRNNLTLVSELSGYTAELC